LRPSSKRSRFLIDSAIGMGTFWPRTVQLNFDTSGHLSWMVLDCLFLCDDVPHVGACAENSAHAIYLVEKLPLCSSIMMFTRANVLGDILLGAFPDLFRPSKQAERQPARQAGRQPASQVGKQPASQPAGQPAGQLCRQARQRTWWANFSCMPGSRQPASQAAKQPASQPTWQTKPARQCTCYLLCGQILHAGPVDKGRQAGRQPARQAGSQQAKQPSSKSASQPARQCTWYLFGGQIFIGGLT
jgi:hypothetical protein